MMDELHLEELSVRMNIVKMDDAFCEALQRAIDAAGRTRRLSPRSSLASEIQKL
jgi:hypothetical protein